MTELPLSNQSNPSQGKDPSGNPELQSTLELKKFLYSICEPMCLKIVQQNPKDIPNYMLNYLKTKYGYSSSGLCFEEQKELEYLRSQVEMFKDVEEHIYYTELNMQIYILICIINAKKEKNIIIIYNIKLMNFSRQVIIG